MAAETGSGQSFFGINSRLPPPLNSAAADVRRLIPSGKESQSLLTSAATVQRFSAEILWTRVKVWNRVVCVMKMATETPAKEPVERHANL
jgi:hypothetical protein